jgi:hypothetical protein
MSKILFAGAVLAAAMSMSAFATDTSKPADTGAVVGSTMPATTQVETSTETKKESKKEEKKDA